MSGPAVAADEASGTGVEGPLRVGLISLGCPKNLVDSERMLGRIAAGHEVTGELEDADVVVVNTCGFVEDAKQESIDTILELIERKKRGELRSVVVTGCLAQRYPEELRRELPEVDAFVGVSREDEVAGLLPSFIRPAPGAGPKRLPMAPALSAELGVPSRGAVGLPPAGPRILVGDPTHPFGAETGRLRLTPRHYAYVRVAEGCDHQCTFCAIPSFRGRFRSKPEAHILTEARELAADGAKELLLIAEDTNQYGMDRPPGEASLASLLGKVASVHGIEWVRILYAYPAYFPDELIDAIASIDEVVKYIDIPLQHIADPVLRRMRRPPRGKTIELLERLRERIPGLTLRTTMIAGFPGETEADHQELVSFIRSFGFDRLGAFAYSEEDGTPAGSYEDQLPPEERARRQAELMEAQQEVAFRKAKERVGRTVRAIVDEVEGEGRAVGRTEGDAPEIDGVVRIYAPGRAFHPGELCRVRITKADGYDLEATPA